jgi:hypothetical protein
LVDSLRAVRPVPQAGGAGPARFRDPGDDGTQQRPGILSARHARAGDVQPIVAAQQQQHALRAAETCCSVDQQLVHGPFLAKYVQAQRGIDEAVRAFARA